MIACEFISIYASLGVEVTVVDSHQQVLSYLSKDVVAVLTDAMQSMGVKFHMESRYSTIEKEDGGICTTFEGGKRIHTDTVLYAQGREPNFDSLRIENANVESIDAGLV